ncbi:MAG: hypothetical protein JXR31_03385 [Prolixibacteraceae bacterium]|nr:hypothetical protein [Prolixibacteraceae bacterium]
MKAVRLFSRPRFLVAMLLLSYLLFSYYALGGWWNSSVGTVLIQFFSYRLWNKEYLKITGLKVSLKSVIFSFLSLTFFLIAFYFLILVIAGKNQVVISLTNWQSYYHTFFYTLNEEIILGAIVINMAVLKLKMKPIVVSVVLAIIFSSIHFTFYKWVFLNRGTIGILTLTTLFFVGILRNNLIIKTGHIGYSWALHFSWMVIMFGLFHSYLDSGEKLLEYERFNLYLGSKGMLILSFLGAILSFLFIINQKKISIKLPG